MTNNLQPESKRYIYALALSTQQGTPEQRLAILRASLAQCGSLSGKW